jgi:benzoylformate decarboxylase
VREVAVDLLRAFGITTVFGNPGSTELPLYREFPEDFRYVLGLQESVVLAMADGFAQATRNAAVVNLHSAVGVGHAMGNLFTAYRNRTPLVVLAGQQARSLLVGEPFLFSAEATELPKPYVRWSCEPARAEDVPAALVRAYYLAMSPPQGPTLVSVPVDDWDRPAEPIAPRPVSTVVRGDPEQIEELAQALVLARRPVFVVGAAVDREGAFDDVVALAEAHRAAVWAAPVSARCSFPQRHPLFAGFLPAAREDIVARLWGHDVIVVLGAPVFTYHVEGAGPLVPDDAALYQLTDDPEEAAWTPVGTSLLTSIGPAVRDLLAQAVATPVGRPHPPARPLPERVVAGKAISQAWLMQLLADLRPDDSIIVEEAPTSRPVMADCLPIDRPESFYTTASGGLGYGLAAAVGVALGRPSQRVIAVVGDGSAMYAIQALWSAARLRLPLTVVVVNNQGYAALDGFARHFGMDKAVGTALGGLDFAGLARAQGCLGTRIERPGDLPDALSAALSSPVPHLLDVLVT